MNYDAHNQASYKLIQAQFTRQHISIKIQLDNIFLLKES